jgi:small subunit ribosomal protein S5
MAEEIKKQITSTTGKPGNYNTNSASGDPSKRNDNRRNPNERRSFGGKRKDRTNNPSDLEKRIISIRRVTRVYSGGKRMRLSVCLVVGDRKGKVGLAMGKGADVMAAEAKAFAKAKKDMVEISLKGKTIAHAIQYKKGASKIILRPAAPGTGVIAGGALRAVLEAVGIEDILTKVIGSSNLINNAYCCLEALQSLKKIN